MKSKKKSIMWLDITYWILIIITTIINIINGFKDGSFDISGISFEQLNIQFYLILIFGIIIFTIINLIIVIFKLFPITVLYIGIKIGRKIFNKQRLDKHDFGKNVDYYRDIIKDYSSGVLNYIDNFTINNNSIIATIMTLQLKGKIDKDLNKINEDISELDENEKYIFSNVSNLNNINFNEFENLVIEDCKKYNLLSEKKIEETKAKRRIVIYIGIIVISKILSFILQDNFWILAISLLLEASCIIAIPVSFIALIAYLAMNSKFPYVRSKQAKEINKNLEGLKKFLQDFSMIKDRTQQELAIWEDYLIYSVIFNQNTKLIEEYENKIRTLE